MYWGRKHKALTQQDTPLVELFQEERVRVRCQVWAGGIFHKSFQDVLVGRSETDMTWESEVPI